MTLPMSGRGVGKLVLGERHDTLVSPHPVPCREFDDRL
jgi:hypothetical protein